MLSLKIPKNIHIQWGKDFIKVTGPLGFILKKRGNLIPIIKNFRLYFLNIKNKIKIFFYLSLIRGVIKGVTLGYKQKLRLIGVGFKATKIKNFLVLKIGYSHEVFYLIPKDINLLCSRNKSTFILIRGIEQFRVSQTSVEIRALRKPDSYKGKGLRYKNEILKLKKGKHESK